MLRPLQPEQFPLADGQRVEVVIHPSTNLHPILKLATEVYERLSAEDIAEIESIALDRSDFFKCP